MMDKIIPQRLRHQVFVYLDDLLVIDKDFDSFINTLTEWKQSERNNKRKEIEIRLQTIALFGFHSCKRSRSTLLEALDSEIPHKHIDRRSARPT